MRNSRLTKVATITALALSLMVTAGCAEEGNGAAGTDPGNGAGTAEPTDPPPSEGGETNGAGGDETNGANGGGGAGDEDTAPGAAFVSPETELYFEPDSPGSWEYTTDIRVGAHDGFDRVVIEFDGPETGNYFIRYVDVPIDRDDSVIEVAGSAFLEVSLFPVSTRLWDLLDDIDDDLSAEEWDKQMEQWSAQGLLLTRRTIPGTGGGPIQEVFYGGWMTGGDTTIVIGVNAERPFRVFTLTNPTRLVVDIQH